MGEYPSATDGDTVTAEDIQRRAQAKIRGISEEQVEFEEVGIEFEIDEGDDY